MTGDPDGPQDDVLGSLAGLRSFDVPPRRARQLRRRCHAMLAASPADGPSRVHGARFRRVIVPALGGAWCLIYLGEIIRRTAAFYGYFR